MLVRELPDRDTGALVDDRLADPWPRLGGSAANVARAAASILGDATVVSGVGDDSAGVRARAELAEAGVRTDGLATSPGRTASSWLFHDLGGGSMSFLDPGVLSTWRLTAAQLRVLDSASWICLTAGPPDVTDAVLDRVGGRTRVLWLVKADPGCFPDTLRARLRARADVVVLNRAERDFAGLTGPPRKAVVITDGTGPVRFGHAGRWAVQSVSPVAVADPTGAGDAFTGALVAALAATQGSALAAAVATARLRTAEFLASRAGSG
ncbi:carbohydrate kinase family protein [Symbioplanes lichenis]|uniref:carbohydrate kinase family protein n=1 Tax=Symbioplanes lichenis TaxID=1629072 RepID=UPI002738AC37|nr:PfkB family carbohydrate kinase [Actinoplanes lichenis]